MQSVGLEESASNLLLLMTQKGSFGLPSLFEFQTETLPQSWDRYASAIRLARPPASPNLCPHIAYGLLAKPKS